MKNLKNKKVELRVLNNQMDRYSKMGNREKVKEMKDKIFEKEKEIKALQEYKPALESVKQDSNTSKYIKSAEKLKVGYHKENQRGEEIEEALIEGGRGVLSNISQGKSAKQPIANSFLKILGIFHERKTTAIENKQEVNVKKQELGLRH